jgi:hypothetical protein
MASHHVVLVLSDLISIVDIFVSLDSNLSYKSTHTFSLALSSLYGHGHGHATIREPE